MSGNFVDHMSAGPPFGERASRIQYATTFARNVLGRPLPHISPDLAEVIANTLSRAEEIETSTHDEWGNWEPRFSQRPETQSEARPWLDELLKAEYSDPGENAMIEPAWPNGSPFALCLTHDVDGVSSRNHGRKLLRRLARVVHAHGPRNVAAIQALGSMYRLVSGFMQADRLGRFEEWLDLEARFGFHSTWYFLPSIYARPHVYDMDYEYSDRVVFRGRRMSVADMIRAIGVGGYEIGLHGSYLSIEDSNILLMERKQVEEVVGRPVQSIRQHYLRYNANLTPFRQEQAGFRCDSTLGFNTSVGFRAGTSFPFWAWNHQEDRPARVLEVPLQIMDAALVRSAPSSVSDAVRKATGIMDSVAKTGGCLTLNWHPNLIDRAPYFLIYESILKEAAARGAWGCSALELSDWWVAREARLLRSAEQDPSRIIAS